VPESAPKRIVFAGKVGLGRGAVWGVVEFGMYIYWDAPLNSHGLSIIEKIYFGIPLTGTGATR